MRIIIIIIIIFTAQCHASSVYAMSQPITSQCSIKMAESIIRQSTPRDSSFLKPTILVKTSWGHPNAGANTARIEKFCNFNK